ncbi:MAG: CoB--CoM heterodisulfide reductase iron-sulfur subunit B family protein [Chloroflexota bacterium]|nr:CoB--CoM heterodisulfide reductase iron-sulfur subunit B family protein [Chloroflexota bacterium]
MRYAYYPGCSLESVATEYDESARAVCERLGIELWELEDWSCCGASSGHCTNLKLSHALPGRNLALAEEQGLDTVAPCPACFLRLKHTRHAVREDAAVREEVERLIAMPYEGRFDARNLVDVIINDAGIEEIRRNVVRSLEGLKVVSYYGCFLVRPPDVVQFDDAENPQSLDLIMEAIGATPLDWSSKVDCCGGSLSLTRRDIVVRLVGDIAAAARDVGAEAMVTACPLCQSNLESRQGKGPLPVFYFTELMGLAFGIPEVRSWFHRHLVSPVALLTSHGLL